MYTLWTKRNGISFSQRLGGNYQNDELREYVYQLICDKVILQYKEKLGIDVEFTDEVLGD